jgi:hypothetical protein
VRAPRFELWWVASHWTVLLLDFKPNRSNVSTLVVKLAGYPAGPASQPAQPRGNECGPTAEGLEKAQLISTLSKKKTPPRTAVTKMIEFPRNTIIANDGMHMQHRRLTV